MGPVAREASFSRSCRDRAVPAMPWVWRRRARRSGVTSVLSAREEDGREGGREEGEEREEE